MSLQDRLNYERIAKAINYIQTHFRTQPDLDEVAAHVQLSPFHFQKLFSEWAGISPKKFLQFTSIEYAKHLLKGRQATLFDTALETGLSGTGRLHDLFINIEGMTPAEYKHGAKALNIHYQFYDTLFGEVLIASTAKGICHLAFADDHVSALQTLLKNFPLADFTQETDSMQQMALSFFNPDSKKMPMVNLHIPGTPFQLKVWHALLSIPEGRLQAYGDIAKQLQQSGASRAVGSAIGSNPVAMLIPCHRVILASGITGGYRWGPLRKTAIIAWEAAKANK